MTTDQQEALRELVEQLAKDIDFAIDVTEPMDVRLRRFQTLIEAAFGVWTVEDQSEDEATVNAVTAVTREADQTFERVGGSSRHWVRDCFLPTLNAHGFIVARIQPEPAALEAPAAAEGPAQGEAER